MAARSTYPLHNLWLINCLVSVHQLLDRPIPEDPYGLTEDDCPRIFIVVEVVDGLLDDVGQSSLLHRVFEDSLNSNVARLEDSCTSTRNIPHENPGVVLQHPAAEFL